MGWVRRLLRPAPPSDQPWSEWSLEWLVERGIDREMALSMKAGDVAVLIREIGWRPWTRTIQVAHGEIRRVTCDGCQDEHAVEATVYALMQSGPVRLTEERMCHACDRSQGEST